jgi:hypothetical protein
MKGEPMKSKKNTDIPAEVERELDEAEVELCILRFDPENQDFIHAVRAALRRRMPTAYELVYDNYNFFVIGYSSTERASDCILSLAADANGVQLMFYYGADLPDPHGLLRGSGVQNRSLRLRRAEDLQRQEIEALIAAAIAQGDVPLPLKGGGKLIIKSVSSVQRPRRRVAQKKRLK